MNYSKRLQEAADAKDLDKFISTYVEACENSSDLGDKAAYLLSDMGSKAVEEVAKMLNTNTKSEDFRSYVANCLVRAISLKPGIGNSKVTKYELIRAVESASTNTEYFISDNAQHALVLIGVKEISGVPIAEYYLNLKDRRLEEDMKNLLGGL